MKRMNTVKAILIFSFVVIFTDVASAKHFGSFHFPTNGLGGDFSEIGEIVKIVKILIRGQRYYNGAWYWYKPGADIEQLQKDYAECREGKREWSCMVYKKAMLGGRQELVTGTKKVAL